MNWYDRVVPESQSEINKLRAEMAELRRKVAALEQFRRDCVPAVGEAMRQVRREIEEKQVRFMGVYEPGRSYAQNSLVVRSGGLWCALSPTTDAPGRSTAWQLVTKQGEVG